MRISIPDTSRQTEDYLATLPEPTYGTQLQDFRTAGQRAEYDLEITYEEIGVALAGGETASLRKPTYKATNLGYGALHPDAMLSPRIAPQMIGLGLLEAIPPPIFSRWPIPMTRMGTVSQAARTLSGRRSSISGCLAGSGTRR